MIKKNNIDIDIALQYIRKGKWDEAFPRDAFTKEEYNQLMGAAIMWHNCDRAIKWCYRRHHKLMKILVFVGDELTQKRCQREIELVRWQRIIAEEIHQKMATRITTIIGQKNIPDCKNREVQEVKG